MKGSHDVWFNHHLGVLWQVSLFDLYFRRLMKKDSSRPRGSTPCACLDRGARYPQTQTVRKVGFDNIHGPGADVEVIRCTGCGRLWLHYFVEYELGTRLMEVGWAMGLVDDAIAATILPEDAANYLYGLDWYVYGGSRFRQDSQRGSGRILW